MRHNQSTNVLLWRGGVSFVVHCNILWFLIGLGPSTRYKPIDFGSYLRSCFVQSLGASKLGPRAALPPRVASTFLSVFRGVLVQLCFHDIQCFSEVGPKFAERPTVEDSPQRLTKKISMKANLENSWDLFPNGYPKHPKVATMETRPPYSRVLARGCRVWKMRSQESADTSTGCTARNGTGRQDLVAVARVSEGILHEGKEMNVVFLRVICHWTKVDSTPYFCLIIKGWYSWILSRNFFCVYRIRDPGIKFDAHDNGICSIHNLSRTWPRDAITSLLISLRLNQNPHQEKGELWYSCN